ncbi:hypothetical protein DPMN_030033 [Dreissena polymorpha]|uniref:Uncharacterized protein n=1 Tax=Dreissena polymorpha TaxID=45954 RepID=A0A9D4RHX7_DREPO|nr:hypothetical protein DPMN_030033 [Dreissena polymorpha]
MKHARDFGLDLETHSDKQAKIYLIPLKISLFHQYLQRSVFLLKRLLTYFTLLLQGLPCLTSYDQKLK